MPSFPHYSQLDQMDCGPTCLRMIAKHYGRSFTLQTLRDRSQFGKEGVSLLGIAQAAESIGFRALGAKVPFEALVADAPLPCIVHWQQKHFVVVYAFKEARGWSRLIRRRTQRQREGGEATALASPASRRHLNVCVADPARGLLTYTADEFCQHWLSSRRADQDTGVALLLEPSPSFYEQEEDNTATYGFERLFKYVWQHKQLLSQLLVGLLVGSGLQLLIPFLTQAVVDVGITTQNVSFLFLILAAQLMLMAGRLTVEFMRSWILLHVSIRINLSILSDFLIKLMKLPVAFFDSRQLGDLMQRINDHNRIEAFLTGQTLTVVFSLLNLTGLSIVLFLYNFQIFCVFLIGTALYIGWVALFLRRRRQLDFKRFDAAARNQSAVIQLIQGMQEIKLAGAERSMRWNWEHLQARLFRLQMKGLSLSQYQQVGALAFNEGKNILITFLAAQAVIKGQLTLGAMLALQYIVGQLNSPVEQLIGFTQGLQDAKISLERLSEIHTLADEEPADRLLSATASGQLRSPVAQAIHLQDVAYQYPGAGNKPVLNDIRLSIPAGRTTAIVGMSGSGKSTLLKLLLKYYEPTQGEIRLGDANLRQISHAYWRSQCGVVMQDGFIFSDTIARNIAVDTERIDIARLEHALLVANLQDFVDALPLGLNTIIGAEGNGISQGQRQRILIARAVYKTPQYIFFDEATNALDANNEAVIMGHLLNFFQGRTVVVVAHRLSTVSHADQIVMMEKGRVVEIGTHAELVAHRGPYWQLVKNQLELGS